MLNRIKKLYQHQKLLLLLILAFAIIAGVILSLITPARPVPTEVISPTPPPAGGSTITPGVTAPPSLNLQPVNPAQKLFINWQSATITPPSELPYYTITSPLIDVNLIKTIATTLGFGSTDAKKTLATTSYLYVKNSQSLFGSTTQNQIQYTNSVAATTTVGFPSLTAINQKAENYLKQFFPDLTFKQSGSPEYFASTSVELYPEKTTPAKANLVRLNYEQTIAGFPLLTTATANSIISFTYDSNQILHTLEITGGFKKTTANEKLKLMDFATLRQVGSRLALPVALDAITDVTSLVQTELEVTLDVEQLSLVYFSAPNGQQILPVFLLKGKVKGKNFLAVPAAYIVPAQY